jgi:hypothetical protein
VALVARNRTRLDTFTGELAADGIEAAGFARDIADRDAPPAMIRDHRAIRPDRRAGACTLRA